MTLGEHVVEDYVSMRLSLKSHPLALLRDRLTPPNIAASPLKPALRGKFISKDEAQAQSSGPITKPSGAPGA
jgi:hypothetical protein